MLRRLFVGVLFTLLSVAAQGQAPASSAAELAKLGPQANRSETRHLVATTSASATVVAPGTRFSLVVDVTPKATMHVYSPEQKDYIPVTLTLDADAAFKSQPAVFPKAEPYFFKALDETQLVYSKPFRIVQDVTVARTPAMRERAKTAGATLTITGTLKYQACDDAICYLPVSVPLSWRIALRGTDR